MKKVVITSIVVLMIIGLSISFADKPIGDDGYNGNGAPSGGHFNLNIIGVQNDKNGNKDSGHVIFVPLDTTGRGNAWEDGDALPSNRVDILLAPAPEGEGFAVLDGDATDDDEAAFQMPADVATTYLVFIRGRGCPTGEADMQLWGFYYDEVAEEWVYDSGNVVEIRGHSVNGSTKFVDVSRDLLKLADGTNVFDAAYEGFFWTYQNNGQKLLQLRFYPIPD